MSISMGTGTSDRPPRIKVWFQAIRPATLTAGLIPVVVGSALAYSDGVLKWMVAAAALLAAISVQVMTNLHNDYEDFVRGADTDERLGQARAMQKGWLSAQQLLLGVAAAGAVGIACASYLFLVAGWPVIAIAISSMVAALAYTGGPFPLAYVGLGDVFVLIFFGLVAVCGTYFIHALTITPSSIIAALAVGLLATAILVVNNLRDRHTDRSASKRTLVVRFGQRFGRLEYTATVILSFMLVAAAHIGGFGGLGWWLPWLSLPIGIRLIVSIWRIDGAELNAYLGKTAALGLVFGLLLSIGVQL